MILDKIFHGVLDQGRGCLLIFEEPQADVSAFDTDALSTGLTYLSQRTYGAAIDTLEQVGKVVDSLYAKVSPSVNLRLRTLTKLSPFCPCLDRQVSMMRCATLVTFCISLRLHLLRDYLYARMSSRANSA